MLRLLATASILALASPATAQDVPQTDLQTATPESAMTQGTVTETELPPSSAPLAQDPMIQAEPESIPENPADAPLDEAPLVEEATEQSEDAMPEPETGAEMPAEEPAPEPAPEAAPEASSETATAGNNAQLVEAVVEKDFPTYDADSSGDLSKEEFSAWLIKLREEAASAQGQPSTMSEEEKSAWAEQAFAAADTDKNNTVSKPELSTFLMG